MKRTTALTELRVAHLEHVFSPAGLPLPVKGVSDQGTTSILVRGGAGTGKTTLALALAHATAKANGGLVLYLTTEFSPVEIAFKATIIGLSEDAVAVWPGPQGMPAGGVLVEHLSVVRAGQPALSSADRKRSVIDVIWTRLHPEPGDGTLPPPPPPVRAVVVDALTLPETGEDEGALRSDLVAFVQALENEGITVVLVEELAPSASAWSSFVVDVVLELSFQADIETHDLRRKLTVLKSRYALSIPGPHDYGLEDGAPAVWPDIFRVVTLALEGAEPLFRTDPPRLMIPAESEGEWVALAADLILSPYDVTSTVAPRVLARTPGMKRVTVQYGARAVISARAHIRSVNEDDGVHAIGWAVLSIARTSSANVCFFDDIGRPLSRPDSSARVNRLLKALCLMGFMVCVHSPENDMLSLEAAATYIWDDKYSARTLRARRHRPFARRCVELPWLREPSWSDRLRQMEAAIDRAGLEALRRDLVRDSWPSTLEFLRFATVDEWIGGNFGGDRRRSLLNAGGQEGRYAAWLATYTGGDWHAARSALAAVKSERPEPKLYLLWKAICGAIAGNRAALKELRGLLGSPDESLVIDPLLRGLAATGRLKHADQIIAELGERHKFAPWMIDRLRADVRLDTDKNSTALEDAARWLESLAQDESLSLVHRAETLHNLGTALDRLGDREAALAVFQRAIALNPFLEASREELAASKNPA